MKNLLDLVLWQFGQFFSPAILGILVFIVLALWLSRVAYKAKTNELSVKYAKIVLQKYKDSRSKIPMTFYTYLNQETANIYPTKIRLRILKAWFKELSKGEIDRIRFYNYGMYGPKINRKKILEGNLIWFSKMDKNSRIYHLKKVISRNSN